MMMKTPSVPGRVGLIVPGVGCARPEMDGAATWVIMPSSAIHSAEVEFSLGGLLFSYYTVDIYLRRFFKFG